MTTLKFSNKTLLELVIITMINSYSYSTTDIIKKLDQLDFKVPKGTLYPILSKLKHQNIIHAQLEEAETKTADMFYYLTEKGENRLKELRILWHSIDRLIYKSSKN